MDRAILLGQAKRLFVWLVATPVVLVTVAIVYFGMPFHGTDASIAAVEENPDITVSQQGETYVLELANSDPEAGLVFYPGGRVHPDAYVGSLAPLVSDANMTVVIQKMPLNLAIFNRGRASRYVTDSMPWYVGGHSLGGVMACRYANSNPDSIDGIMLFASYCDRDLSGSGLAGLSVTGSEDTVLNRDQYEANLANLPSDATVEELLLNHTQFGSYRGQPGDQPSGLDYAVAHEQLANVTVPWIRSQG